MKKLIGALLVLFLAVWLWPKSKERVAQSSAQEENLAEDEVSEVANPTTFRPPVTTTSIVPLTTTTQQLEITTTLPPSTTQLPHENVATTTTQELTRRQLRDQKAFELAQEKMKVTVGEEMNRSIPFKIWPRNELGMTGMFQGKIHIDGKENILRLNLAFNPDTGAVSPDSCVALFSREKVVFRESYRGRKFGFLNPPEKGYIIISVLGPYNIELFRIGAGSSRIFQANLFVLDKAPVALQMDIIQGVPPQDRCLQVY